MKNSYKAFTLIEMLIVMGIIMILMTVGITSGRYAINRANDIAHQNAVDQIYEALQAYYTDYREYPFAEGKRSQLGNLDNGGGLDVETLLDCSAVENQKCLMNYMEVETFDGGSAADYVYMTNANAQSVIVCVTLGGIDDTSERGWYCTGNGFGDSNFNVSGLDTATLSNSVNTENANYNVLLDYSLKSTWYGEAWDAAEE